MFTKDQPDVINEEDVGNLVAELNREATDKQKEGTDGLVRTSQKPSNGTESKS